MRVRLRREKGKKESRRGKRENIRVEEVDEFLHANDVAFKTIISILNLKKIEENEGEDSERSITVEKR